MATITIPDDPAERLETAQLLIDEHGAENVTTRSEPGVGVVFVVPDEKPEPTDDGSGSEPVSTPEPQEPAPAAEPEPKAEKPAAAPKKAPAAAKSAAAGAAATD